MSALKKLSDVVSSKDLHVNPNCVTFTEQLPIIQKNIGVRENLISEIKSEDDQQNRKTNVKAHMTGWFMHNYSSNFAWVCGQAIKIADENNPTSVKLDPFDCWGVIYNKGDWTKVHNHWPSVWSFVYYVKACINCSPLVFPDCNDIRVMPKSGNMVMFPGWVRHSVPEQTCDHERIVVAGNLLTNIWT